jgi:hypothetical protein
MRTAEGGRPLGQTLVDAGILTPADLQAAVLAQVERIVLSVLRWTSGTLRREAMDRPIPADQALDLSTNRLLLLGMRLFPDAERLERALGDPARRLRRVSPPPFDYEQVESSPAERAALAIVRAWRRDRRSTGLAALPAAGRAAVHALLWGGLIEDAPMARPAAAPCRRALRRRPAARLRSLSRARGPEPEPARRPRSPERRRDGPRLSRRGP